MSRRAEAAGYRLWKRLPRRARTLLIRWGTPSFFVGAVCVIRRSDGAVVLLRNSYRSGWGLPGGLLRRGESAEAAVRREVREEVGMELVLDGPPIAALEPRARRIDLIFAGRPADDGAAPQPQSAEIVEAAWFDTGSLPELQKETAAALRLTATS